MPIQLQTGAGQRVFNFNETRLEKILNARTSGEAERMGWVDRLTDRFQGGVKRQAIRELYASINAPAPHESRPADVLERFHRLRDLAVPDDREQFAVELAPPNDQGKWGYALLVGDTRIHSSPPGMRDSAETSFVAFQDEVKTDHLLHQTIALAERCRAAEHPIQGKGGYVDLEALNALRTQLNQVVNRNGLGFGGVDAFERLLELQKTRAPIVGQAFSAMLDTKVGSTNLLAIVYGDRAPSAASARLASLAHQIVSGDPLDITAAAKHLGDQMMEDYPEAVLTRPTNSLKPNLARLPNRCPIPAFHLFTRLILTNRTSFRRLSRWAAFQCKLRAALGRPTRLRTGPSGSRPSPALNLSHGASAP